MARVLTWHVHGNYMLYLSRARHEFLLPVSVDRRAPYGGRGASFDWPDNVSEIPLEDVRYADVDVVLYQSEKAWREDRVEVLSQAQRRLPAVYLEHDPPRESAYATSHPVVDPSVLVVHVTHFNSLMWDCGSVPTTVVEHGVEVPADVGWTGELERGLVIVNDLASRGRRLGADVFEEASRRIPLDLVGMRSEELGGLGEVAPRELAAFAARYRFLFNPIRWTSLGLAVCEALHVGLPVIGLATTEMTRAIDSGVMGYVDTDVDALVGHMQRLLEQPGEASRLSEGARRIGRARFGIERFAAEWTALLEARAQAGALAA